MVTARLAACANLADAERLAADDSLRRMKILGHPASTCTRKVLTTLHETGHPHEFVLVDIMVGAHKQPEHLKHQPFGQVPALQDNGFEMYESRAMCRYINEMAKGKLVPTDPRDRAKMEQWISVEMSDFTPPAMKFIYHHIFKSPQSDDVLAKATKDLNLALDVMDAQLAKQPYFVGETFTLADIGFMPYVGYLMATPEKEQVAKHGPVSSWWNRVRERMSWRKATGEA